MYIAPRAVAGLAHIISGDISYPRQLFFKYCFRENNIFFFWLLWGRDLIRNMVNFISSCKQNYHYCGLLALEVLIGMTIIQISVYSL